MELEQDYSISIGVRSGVASARAPGRSEAASERLGARCQRFHRTSEVGLSHHRTRPLPQTRTGQHQRVAQMEGCQLAHSHTHDPANRRCVRSPAARSAHFHCVPDGEALDLQSGAPARPLCACAPVPDKCTACLIPPA